MPRRRVARMLRQFLALRFPLRGVEFRPNPYRHHHGFWFNIEIRHIIRSFIIDR